MDLTSYFYVVYGALFLGGAVLSGVFQHYHAAYRTRFLGLWAGAYLCLAVSALATAVTLGTVATLGGTHPLRLVMSAIAAVGIYLQIFWLLAGLDEFANERGMPTGRLVACSAAIVAFGIGITLPFAFDPDAAQARVILRVVVRHSLVGVATLSAAILLFVRHRAAASFGARIVAVSLVVFALAQLASGTLAFVSVQFGLSLPFAASLTVLDTVTQFTVGLGLVIWLLEKERLRAHAAGAEAEFHRRHDQLTHLPNRESVAVQLTRTLDHLDPRTTQVAVMHVGLDRFKQINSSFGRWAGDEVLRQYADRIRAVPSTGGFAGRLGADEFLLVQSMKAGDQGISQLAERVRRLARSPFQLGDNEAQVDASVGVALCPQDSDDPELLLKQADLAMQRIKTSGGRGVGFYSPELDQAARQRYRLEQDFQQALANNDLYLVFQPIVRSSDGLIVGVEALARWEHPTMGELRPDEFLPSALEAGLIPQLDAWALREALRTAEAWRGRVIEPFLIAVNSAPETFQDPGLETTVAAALKAHECAHVRVEMEITEQTAIQDLELARSRIQALEKMGVQVALDDFGIGYSSLGHLQLLRTPVIKLDRAFVGRLPDDRDAATILEAVVPMLQKLGRSIVAEGVQTREQAEFVRRIGVDYQQGYYYYRPLPARDLSRLLETDAATTAAQ
ncbi:MAG: EAL domain-containing protein [Xanthomonadales bacterium]|nr:EAL domain-containing protein [Xanthomonadales bacterium]